MYGVLRHTRSLDHSLAQLATLNRTALLDGEMGKLSDEGAKLARFLDNRICVPRDMGCLPVQGLRALAKNQRGG